MSTTAANRWRAGGTSPGPSLKSTVLLMSAAYAMVGRSHFMPKDPGSYTDTRFV